MTKRTIELTVGIFMLVGLFALILLAFKMSGLTDIGGGHFYVLKAQFDNIGGLKKRAPVSMAGVTIGRVANIYLDKNNFRANVILHINSRYHNIPIDSSASIFTQGILGANYVSLSPGFEEKNFKNNEDIETTHSALVLENLIGQLIYSLKSDKKSDEKVASAKEK